MFLGVLNTIFLKVSNYLPHLQLRNHSIQIVVIRNFVVISNVSIKRFDCTTQWCNKRQTISNINQRSLGELRKYSRATDIEGWGGYFTDSFPQVSTEINVVVCPLLVTLVEVSLTSSDNIYSHGKQEQKTHGYLPTKSGFVTHYTPLLIFFIYLPTEFEINNLNNPRAMLWAKFIKKKVQVAITQQTDLEVLRTLHPELLLITIYLPMKI